ncbi:HAD-IA family hydrolase [Nigerium massiliense]|uniref:HAD-IA family hydrolase n=1 Tax=Nigerium massiliense TaxID=1522317 RepID=UPI00059091AF|nr:HAD-IA family hydrolase [Nigerium massiliense]
MIRCVAFDYGQVLASPENLFTEPAERLRVDPEAYEKAYWNGRGAYDEGGSDASYWKPLLTSLGVEPHPETIHMMVELDTELWLQMRPEARKLMQDVRAAGCTVAVVSNAPFVLDMGFANADFAEDADYWFVSASMNMTKPNKGVYLRVEEVTEIAPEEIAFIDDRPENVQAAREQGWRAHLFVNDADTREWLEEVGVLA